MLLFVTADSKGTPAITAVTCMILNTVFEVLQISIAIGHKSSRSLARLLCDSEQPRLAEALIFAIFYKFTSFLYYFSLNYSMAN